MTDDSDDQRLVPNSPEWFAENRRRHGHPLGAHRTDEIDETMRGAPFHPRADVSDLVEMLHGMAGSAPPAPPPKSPWISLPAVLGAILATISIVGAAAAVLQGYTQLGDRVQSFGERMLAMDSRVTLLEKDFQLRGHTRDEELSTLKAANSLQDERLQNITKAIEQERQARADAEADLRRSEADLRAEANDLAKALSEIRTDLKVLVDRADRPHAALAHPDHEAQVVPGAR